MTNRKAYRVVREAVAAGILSRPAFCSKCKNVPAPTKDGRPGIQAHHEDYSKPLEIEWLCSKCHKAITPVSPRPGWGCYGESNGMRTKPHCRPKGESNGFAKLTETSARDILLRRMTAVEYANKHGVARRTVYDVLSGATWSWLDAARTRTAAPADGDDFPGDR